MLNKNNAASDQLAAAAEQTADNHLHIQYSMVGQKCHEIDRSAAAAAYRLASRRQFLAGLLTAALWCELQAERLEREGRQ